MTTSESSHAVESLTRRRFFAWVGWSSFAAFWASIGMASGRFFFPKTLYEPSPRFQAGKPEDYTVGEVRFLKDPRVWIVRTHDGLYALRAVCTHLGCIPIWHGREDRFKCPCHGSNFTLDGTNISGPAPVPLHRLAIALDQDGKLIVDKSRTANQAGERDRPPFLLPLAGKGSSVA